MLLACYRSQLPEPNEFKLLQKKQQLSANPIKESFKNYKKNMWLIFLLGGYLSLYVYICSGFYASYLRTVSAFSNSQATYFTLGSQLCITLFMPLLAYLLHKANLYKILTLGVILFSLVAPAQYYLADTQYSSLLIIILTSYALASSLCSIAIIRFIFNTSPTHIRCTSISIAYNMAVALFGGTAPALCELLIQHTNEITPGLYVALMGIILLFFIGKPNNKLLISSVKNKLAKSASH
jgi:MFS transporter, MHS family, proline/betaine transporter